MTNTVNPLSAAKDRKIAAENQVVVNHNLNIMMLNHLRAMIMVVLPTVTEENTVPLMFSRIHDGQLDAIPFAEYVKLHPRCVSPEMPLAETYKDVLARSGTHSEIISVSFVAGNSATFLKIFAHLGAEPTQDRPVTGPHYEVELYSGPTPVRKFFYNPADAVADFAQRAVMFGTK